MSEYEVEHAVSISTFRWKSNDEREAGVIINAIQLTFMWIERSTYTTDLSLHDVHVFGPIKQSHKVTLNVEVEMTVKNGPIEGAGILLHIIVD